ncbi:MAG: IS200/IS605 family transposase [Chloroflexota bacterium]
MAFIVVYYHVVWATKYRLPLITEQIEPLIFDVIRAKSKQFKSPIHAINAVSDHIHIAVEISQTVALYEWVRQVKAVSSRIVNKEFPHLETRFYWQKSYSIHSFGKKRLPFVTRYIDKQKQHHEQGTLEPYLEQVPDD